MAAPSWQDKYDIGLYTLQARRPTLQVNFGDVTDAVLVGAATMADSVQAAAAAETRSTFLDGAEDEQLTEEAHDRGVDRDQGDAAVGTVAFTRPNASGGAGTIPAGFTVGTEPDENGSFSTYTTDTAAVFSSLDLTKSVTATCTVIGPEGNALEDTVTRTLGAMFDATITVNNDDRFVGGENAEQDADLRDRTRGFFLTQARGTAEAVIFGAKTVPSVKRASLLVDDVTGVGTLFVSDREGNSNAAMVDAVEIVLPEWKAFDSIINVVGATLALQAIDISLTLTIGTDQAAVIDKVRQSIVSALNTLNPGDILYLDLIRQAAKDVDRQNVLQCVVNTPAANVAPGSNEVIRTTIDLITTS